ncbi:MAG: hypothetical protein Q9193_001943 [Seirophora villosa]
MFFLHNLERTVTLHPSFFGPRTKEYLTTRLLEDVEGTCTGQYYIICVLDSFLISEGRVVPGSGVAEYTIQYRAVVWRPFKGETVDAIVTSVNQMGVFADVGPLPVFVSNHLIPPDIKWDPNATPPQYTDNKDQVIEKGTHLRIKLIGTRSDVGSMFAIGSVKEDFLGMLAGAFADRDSDASGLSMNAALHEPQQVLHPDNGFAEDVEIYDAAPQNPQILEDDLSTIPTDLAVYNASSNGTSLAKALELAQAKATELDLKQVASDIEMWVKQHPWRAGFYAASAISFFAPEILSIPALEALGFGLAGVRAGMLKFFIFECSSANQDGWCSGSLAAKIQSFIGNVVPRSFFAIWQSARLGGYGVKSVNGAVRALVALTDAAVAGCNPLKDCKGFLSDGGQRSLGASSATTVLAVVCGCLVGLNLFIE